MFEELIKEYACLKTEAEFAVRFANMLQSLLRAVNEDDKNDVSYYVRSNELLEEYYRREV